MSRVIMAWNSKTCLLPPGTKEYKETLGDFKNDILLALMTEKDTLNEIHWQKTKRQGAPNLQTMTKDQKE